MSSSHEQTISELYERGAHMGYSRSRRHPSVVPHLYGMKNRIDIIDLENTSRQLVDAKTMLASVKASGKSVIIVGCKPETRDIVARLARISHLSSVTERWIGGTLTNWPEIRRRIEKMKKLKEGRDAGTLVYQTKKELLMIEREIEDLESKFGGIESLEAVPGAIIVVDPRHEHICVEEARQKKIPVVAIANTDCDITTVDYPVMANDANAQSVHYIITSLLDALK
jgi:small subunit ribosomal protein S2